jgi:hypothetical protein
MIRLCSPCTTSAGAAICARNGQGSAGGWRKTRAGIGRRQLEALAGVAAKIEGQDVEALGQERRDPVPPVAVGGE